jgi:hypothetical protein
MRQLQRYLDLISELRTEEKLEAATIAMIPRLKDGARIELIDAWSDQIGLPPRGYDMRRVSEAQVRQFIGAKPLTS